MRKPLRKRAAFLLPLAALVAMLMLPVQAAAAVSAEEPVQVMLTAETEEPAEEAAAENGGESAASEEPVLAPTLTVAGILVFALVISRLVKQRRKPD